MKLNKVLQLLTSVCVFIPLTGCQFDVDGGIYRTPRVSAKLMYKGEDETANHSASRDTGTFGTGNSFGMMESPTSNRKSTSFGILNRKDE